MLATHARGTVRLCPIDDLKCPRCGATVHRTEISGGHMFALCEGKVEGGERCNSHLLSIVADFLPEDEGEEEGIGEEWALVAVISREQRREIRDLASAIRRRRARRRRRPQPAAAGD